MEHEVKISKLLLEHPHGRAKYWTAENQCNMVLNNAYTGEGPESFSFQQNSNNIVKRLPTIILKLNAVTGSTTPNHLAKSLSQLRHTPRGQKRST